MPQSYEFNAIELWYNYRKLLASKTMSQDFQTFLDGSPKMSLWYRQGYVKRPTETYSLFVWDLLKGLLTPGKDATRYWVQGVEAFLRNSETPLDDFLLADSLSQELGKPVTEILGALCEKAVRLGEGSRAFAVMQALSARTNLSALRFLTAWTALNLNDLATCVEECEKERQPYAPIHTLLGQALLELGKPEDAIDALKVAVSLDRNDPLPLFQLIKAFLVTKQHSEAVRWVGNARELMGDHVEVECLSALIVIDDQGRDQRFATETSERLLNLFSEDSGNLELMCLIFEVQEVLANQQNIQRIFEEANFNLLTKNREFTKRMAEILKKLGAKGWFGLSKALADRLLEIGPKQRISSELN